MATLLAATVFLAFAIALTGCSSHPSPSPTASAVVAQRIEALTVGEGEARSVVELFGWRLQNVSLQSPFTARALRKEYSGLVAPALPRRWLSHPTTAPGRLVSSPWPDHIEIDHMAFHGTNSCTVSAHLIMMTSLEVANGGAAARIPIRLELSHATGVWVIAGYRQLS